MIFLNFDVGMFVDVMVKDLGCVGVFGLLIFSRVWFRVGEFLLMVVCCCFGLVIIGRVYWGDLDLFLNMLLLVLLLFFLLLVVIFFLC